jgi:Sec-independent protein secretion pathway component TatC
MLLAMAPLVVLWELSVLLARLVERRREARPDDRWDALEDPPTLS